MIQSTCMSLNVESMNPAQLCEAITSLLSPLKASLANSANVEFVDGEPLKMIHLTVQTHPSGKQTARLEFADRTGEDD